MFDKKSFYKFLLILLATFSYQKNFSQCFQIESILVDACGQQEGLNEMVRFKVGAAAINTNNMTVSWPNNPWQGLIKNSVTASKTASLNADILDAGGCGQLIEPVAGNLPALAKVILVTSFNMDTELNSFGSLTEDIYIIYQNNPSTASGHFANSGTGNRTLRISFSGCSDTVTYDRARLIDTNGATVAADGATVVFDNAGNPTYINNGCSAPVPPFTVDAGPATINACSGTTILLTGLAQGYTTVRWSADTGSFSAEGNLVTNYMIATSATGVITMTLTATNSCGLEISDHININVSNGTIPNFPTTIELCTGNTPPVLNATSPNGISGTWIPNVISNTTSGNYRFIPNPNQCASEIVLRVNIVNNRIPDFQTSIELCTGNIPPVLNATSPNGISGTWIPNVISNTTSGNYRFIPNPNQCASEIVLRVNITNNRIPDFQTSIELCTGNIPPVLNATSPNGISGIWIPNVINNTTSGNYRFIPNPNQCASEIVLRVNITNNRIPDFLTSIELCTGNIPPVLNATSPNGISGTWIPNVINNTTSGNYRFVPNPNQCASEIVLRVNITNNRIPDFLTSIELCTGNIPPVLNATSPNGISGTWIPNVISNTTSGNYRFVPNPNQCASEIVLRVNITNNRIPDFQTNIELCTGNTPPVLNATSPNGISGTWIPNVINNTTSGNYRFVPNPNQCASEIVLRVNITNNRIPDFQTNIELCTGNTPPVLNATSPNGISGTWIPAVIDNLSDGVYTFKPDAGQCAQDFILQISIRKLNFTISQKCEGQNYIARAVLDADNTNLNYTWTDNFGDIVGSESALNITALSDKGYEFPHTFQLEVSNDEGCKSAQPVTVNGLFCSIPKGISPNNDGKNDVFDLTGLNVKELTIFNRYGTEVYQAFQYTNQWGGFSNKGEQLPDGTYYYVIITASGENFTGWVYINK